jgi:drug/metabolite transporter (DMT)-like permease
MTALALIAFAANSLLCRAALADGSIDAASFTNIRLIAGAAVLWLIVRLRAGSAIGKGNWLSALALFVYAAGFSFAYLELSTATGALLLFGAVQSTMIGYGLYRGERLRLPQLGGLVLAIGGLVGLLLPGLSAPPPLASALMLGAGAAWGIYSLRGKGAGDPLQVTAGNFLRAVPIALLLSAALLGDISLQSSAGIGYAMASGALASGLGYAVWYSALPALKASTAASVQLSVPVIAALGGVVLLAEPLSLRLLLASLAILGGIALVILTGPRVKPAGR